MIKRLFLFLFFLVIASSLSIASADFSLTKTGVEHTHQDDSFENLPLESIRESIKNKKDVSEVLLAIQELSPSEIAFMLALYRKENPEEFKELIKRCNLYPSKITTYVMLGSVGALGITAGFILALYIYRDFIILGMVNYSFKEVFASK